MQWTWECGYLFDLLILIPLDKYSEVGLMDHTIVVFLIFLENSILFFIMAPL